MTERKPLVNDSGISKELPVGDTIPNDAIPLKTVNGNSLYGTGDITVTGGAGSETTSPFFLMGA